MLNDKALEAGWRALSADLQQQWPLPLDEDGLTTAEWCELQRNARQRAGELEYPYEVRRDDKGDAQLFRRLADALEAARAKLDTGAKR